MSPTDPRSLEVMATFGQASVVAARHALPLVGAFAVFILPEVALFAVAAPHMASAMFGAPPTDVPTGEWLAFAGILLLAFVTGGLGAIAVAFIADETLAGRPSPGLGAAFGRAIERVPAVLGAYLGMLGLACVLLVPLFILMTMTVGATAGQPPFAAVVGIVLGVLVVLPLMVAVGTYLRFGPILAAVRERGPLSALRDSYFLVRGRCLRVLGYLLVVGFVAQVATNLFMMIAGGVAAMASPGGPLPTVVVLLYGGVLSTVIAFQLVQEVALLRRIEALNTPPEALLDAPPQPSATDELPFEA